MNKILIPLAAAASLLAFGPAAHAQAQGMRMGSGTAYGELGYSMIDISGGGGSAKPSVLRGIVGADVHPNVAVEAMLGFGVRDDNGSVGGLPANVEVRHTYGLFAKPKINFDRVEVFGRLGYARTKVRTEVAGLTLNDTKGDFAYGLGANFNITPRSYAGLDWMKYYDKDGAKADGFSVNVGMRF